MNDTWYRGYTIEYRPSQFTVEAIVKNGRGKRLWELGAYGIDRDDAFNRVKHQIDYRRDYVLDGTKAGI